MFVDTVFLTFCSQGTLRNQRGSRPVEALHEGNLGSVLTRGDGRAGTAWAPQAGTSAGSAKKDRTNQP